jgi:hypothetical protein
MACTPPTVIVGGVTLSTSDFQNAQEILNTVSGAGGDPTLDEYTENVANGNNSANRNRILIPSSPTGVIPTQTALPPPIPQKADQSITSQAVGGNGTPVSCTIWIPGDYNAPLSANFTLRQFTVNAKFPYPLTDYNLTYTAQTRFCNLQNLATNIAEPLLLKFGNFNINSGIRNKTSATTGLSQHITGQAMDVQFPGWTYARYWENAAWVKDNLPYDQFIFEHSSSTGLAWYHLSYNSAGNRPVTIPTKIMTMYRNNYSPGLHRYG